MLKKAAAAIGAMALTGVLVFAVSFVINPDVMFDWVYWTAYAVLLLAVGARAYKKH